MPLVVKPSAEELSANRLSWDNLQLATRAIHRDGLVVVEDAVSLEDLDSLNAKMCQDARYLQSLGDNGPFNYNKGNIQQDPPLTTTYFRPSIFLNPLVTQLTTSVLGPRPRLSFISGNSALPPAPDFTPTSQPVHSDADFAHPDCPFALVVNVPLITMTPGNGSTEVWLGTHAGTGLHAQEGLHGERASGRIKQDLLAARAQERPPAQPVVKRGSAVIRDLRLWHAGKPNMSGEIRVMLALIHFAQWYRYLIRNGNVEALSFGVKDDNRLTSFRNPMQVEFDEMLRPTIEAAGADLQVHADFLPGSEIEARYLNRPYGNAYDFDQAERLQDIF